MAQLKVLKCPKDVGTRRPMAMRHAYRRKPAGANRVTSSHGSHLLVRARLWAADLQLVKARSKRLRLEPATLTLCSGDPESPRPSA